MLFIVLNHYSGEEPWQHLTNASNAMLVSYYIYKPLGQVGVNLFVLITGYFLIERLDTLINSIKRVLKVYLEVWFYSALTCIIGIIFLHSISLREIVTSFIPVVFNRYWFVTAYVMLMLLVPFINKMVVNITQKQYLYLLVCITIFAEILPILNNTIFSLDKAFGDLLAVYLLGGYIRKYRWNIKNIYRIPSIILIYLVMLSSIIALGKITEFSGNINRLTYGLLPFLEAGLIFTIFVEAKPFTNNIINKVASSVFATYLFTETPNMDIIIWQKLFNMSTLKNPFLIILAGLGIAMILLIITIVIDKCRIFLFKHLKIETHALKFTDFISSKYL